MLPDEGKLFYKVPPMHFFSSAVLIAYFQGRVNNINSINILWIFSD